MPINTNKFCKILDFGIEIQTFERAFNINITLLLHRYFLSFRTYRAYPTLQIRIGFIILWAKILLDVLSPLLSL